MIKNDQKKILFLIADDHSLIRQGLVFLIEEIFENFEILQAANFQQIIEIIKTKLIDIAILDAQFPEGNILKILSEIKELIPEIKIMIFTGIDEQTYALKYINAGVNGFLSKMSDEDEIKNAILRIYLDGKYISSAVQTLLINAIHNPAIINPLSSLSERELQIAKLYAEGMGNLEIANELNIKQNTVSTLKKRIFEKLHIENIVELIDILKNNE